MSSSNPSETVMVDSSNSGGKISSDEMVSSAESNHFPVLEPSKIKRLDLHHRRGSEWHGPTRYQKRKFGFLLCMSYVVGGIIGNGIFVVPPAIIMKNTGSVFMGSLAWILAGFTCLMGARCLIKLILLVPHTAGPIYYLKTAFGDQAAFLFIWVRTVFLVPSSQAISCFVFAQYAILPFLPDCGSNQLPVEPVRIIAIISLWTIHFINGLHAGAAAILMIVTTIVKLLSVLFFIYYGFYTWSQGNLADGEISESFTGGFFRPFDFLVATYYAYYAFNGWEVLSYIIGEIEELDKTIARALLSGLTLTSIIYVLCNFAYWTGLGTEGVKLATACARDFILSVAPQHHTFVTLAVSISAAGILNRSVLVSSKTYFEAAKLKYFPKFLTLISCTTHTELPALVISSIMGTVLLIFCNPSTLIPLNTNTTLFLQLLIVASLVKFRFYETEDIAFDRISVIEPFFFITIVISLLAVSVISHPMPSLVGFSISLSAPAIHYFFLRKSSRPIFWVHQSDKIARFCQKFFVALYAGELDIF